MIIYQSGYRRILSYFTPKLKKKRSSKHLVRCYYDLRNYIQHSVADRPIGKSGFSRWTPGISMTTRKFQMHKICEQMVENNSLHRPESLNTTGFPLKRRLRPHRNCSEYLFRVFQHSPRQCTRGINIFSVVYSKSL